MRVKLLSEKWHTPYTLLSVRRQTFDLQPYFFYYIRIQLRECSCTITSQKDLSSTDIPVSLSCVHELAVVVIGGCVWKPRRRLIAIAMYTVLKDADHPMIHAFLGYDIICILHVHILHPGTHHSVLLHHNKPPRDIRFLNLNRYNVNHNVSMKVNF